MRKMIMWIFSGIAMYSALANAQSSGNDDIDGRSTGNELDYRAYVHSTKRIKCLYGYAADKTGDHAAAIQIFEDCIQRWSDVFSMIWLAQIYETGIGVDQDFAKATNLMQQAAHIDDGTGYPSLARYHYGVALAEGHGIKKNIAEARIWLKKAAGEGVKEAADYLNHLDANSQ